MQIDGGVAGLPGQALWTMVLMEDEEACAIQGDDESSHQAACIERFHAYEASEAEGPQLCQGLGADVAEEVIQGLVYR